MARRLVIASAPSPIGTMCCVTAGDTLVALEFADRDVRLERLLRARFGVLDLVEGVLDEVILRGLERYFSGDVRSLETISADPGGTAFQRRVWGALRAIPPGATMTYVSLARELDLPMSAARAVGHANSLNPIAVVVPCHRLIGADGKLTGYAGGLQRKRWLLDHEAAGSLATAAFRLAAGTSSCDSRSR